MDFSQYVENVLGWEGDEQRSTKENEKEAATDLYRRVKMRVIFTHSLEPLWRIKYPRPLPSCYVKGAI